MACACRELPRPDLLIPGFRDAPALLAILVLIDGDDFAVGEISRWPESCSVNRSGEQRRGKNRPQAHVRFVFVVGHAAVADFEHVRIVPVSGAPHGASSSCEKPMVVIESRCRGCRPLCARHCRLRPRPTSTPQHGHTGRGCIG